MKASLPSLWNARLSRKSPSWLQPQSALTRSVFSSCVTILNLSVFVFVYFFILSSCRVTFWHISCSLSSLSIVFIFTCELSPSTTRVYVSPFGYFWVSRSFSITSFTPRFLRNFPLLPYLHSHYVSFTL